ncbi:MAG TPA: four helix bundle protein [Flavobacteriales bacterium]|nr:four helix bundle protein [Flavobacteriales bacterium]
MFGGTNTTTAMGKVQDLFAYKTGFKLSMDIFQRTKRFPKEEQYSMTDQIRRSSRSVVANLAEAYRRRRTLKYFEAKLNDCETELCETQVWLEFALACEYITQKEYDAFNALADEVGSLLNFMARNPKKFI